jgi:preprotein translocase subunit SecY
MFKTIVNAFKDKEIRTKILITLALLLVYRLGCWLPVPGINVEAFASSVGGQDFLSLLSSVSGGALANGAILALGISPYISASIIIQLLTIAIPSLERLSKMGEEGKKKISLYTKICALVLAIVQAIAIVLSYSSALNTLTLPEWLVSAMVVIILVAGSMFTYWLGEKITSYGIGNGMSLLIFVGILSTAGSSLYFVITNIFKGSAESLWELLLFIVALVFIFGFIVFMDLGERRIPVQYAKQVKGRKMYGGQNTFIPIRVNATGVMPIIFASSIISFPQLLFSIFWPESGFYKWYSTWLGTGGWIYIILTGLLILFFAYFWTQITFNPEDISRNIQQNGGFILGIRPGKPTAEYLKKISNRITLFGAIFLAIIAIVPSIIFKSLSFTGGLTNAFSATGLLIVVSVAIELDKALDSQMLMKNYKGFLK